MMDDLPDDYSPYPQSLFGRASRAFSHFTEYLGGSGGWKLKPLQQQILDALLPALEPEIRILLVRQLAQPFFMQFWHKGKISPFFFNDFRLPREMRLPCPEFEDKLYKIEMLVDGRKQHANVVFTSGRIHRIELKQQFKFYEGKEIRFGAVTVGRLKQSIAVAIDRQEHGKTGHIATGED